MPVDLRQYLESQRNAMLAALEALVSHETPSDHKAGLDAFADRLTDRFTPLGLAVERIPNARGGDHLRLQLNAPDASERPGLVLCHFDTVCPIGTIARRPFRIESDRAYGPGVYDMKASLVLVEFALRALKSRGESPRRPIILLFTSDEEVGSPTSRDLIEQTCRTCEYVLVMEPPLGNGRLKTGRKGVGRWTIDVTGRSAHAGVEPEKGVNALVELAHQILAITALADPSAGTTVNVGRAEGGTKTNVVPEHASAAIDVRVTTQAEARRVASVLAALQPVLPGAELHVEGGLNRPPMERTEGVARLYEQARRLGLTLGLDLGEGSTGGGSDGNFTAALGVPTLDGLGTPGDGAHAEHEHIQIPALPERAALLATLLRDLTLS